MKTNEPFVGSNASPISVRKFSVKEVLGALISFLILFIFLPLEYDNIKAKTIIYPIMWISMGYIVFKAFPGKSLTKSSLLIILGIICLFYTFSHVIGFCAWIKHGTSLDPVVVTMSLVSGLIFSFGGLVCFVPHRNCKKQTLRTKYR